MYDIVLIEERASDMTERLTTITDVSEEMRNMKVNTDVFKREDISATDLENKRLMKSPDNDEQ